MFPEGDVDTFESATDGSSDGPFERDLVAGDGVAEIGWDVLAKDLEGLGPGSEPLPLPLDSGRLEDAYDGLRNFRADAIAGDEGDLVCFCLGHCQLLAPRF